MEKDDQWKIHESKMASLDLEAVTEAVKEGLQSCQEALDMGRTLLEKSGHGVPVRFDKK